MVGFLVFCATLIGFGGCQVVVADTEQLLSIMTQLVPLINLNGISNFCDIIILSNVTKKCGEQLKIVCENPDIMVKMLDASAKFPYAGMLYAARMEYGNFDECLSIEYSYEGNRLLGKYCLAGLVIPVGENLTDIDMFFKLATCTPNACSAQDLISIGKTFYNDFPPIFIDEYCTTIDTGKEYSIWNIIMTTIFVLTILLLVISTIYDVYLYYTERTRENSLLLAFSVFTNGRKLLSISPDSRDHIQIFNGMKVISIMWVIAGHGFGTFIGGLFQPLNKETLATFHSKRYSTYIDAAHMSVDTFIFMSGFLVAYHYLKGRTRPLASQLKGVPYFYLHRYLRISPPVIMIYLLTMFVFPKFGSGPYWHPGLEGELRPCREHWWSYFLYIQNYVNYNDLCFVPHWYLSVDMQMFILSPLVLIPISLMLKRTRGFFHSMTFLVLLNVAFIALPIALALQVPEYENGFATHSRLTDFYIGFMMGVFMRQKKGGAFLSKFDKKHRSQANLIIWVLVIAEMFAVVLFYQDAEMNQNYVQRAFYFGLSRPAWCIGLCWITYSSFHGYGGFVNWFLSRPIFQIGAKLSYCMYVVHYMVIGHYTLSSRMKWYFSDYVEFYLWCGYFIETLLWASFWTLAFESPVLAIEKLTFARAASEVPRQSQTQATENKEP